MILLSIIGDTWTFPAEEMAGFVLFSNVLLIISGIPCESSITAPVVRMP